jgi:hypothetical protein
VLYAAQRSAIGAFQTTPCVVRHAYRMLASVPTITRIRHLKGNLIVKLHHMPGACSLADLIVLQWVGAFHEPVRMSLESIKSPDFLADPRFTGELADDELFLPEKV